MSQPTASHAREVATNHLQGLTILFNRLDLDAVERVLELLRTARDSGATIYVAGNGGSAATAAHWTNDLGKRTKHLGQPPIRVMCLGDNTPWLTALGNDEGYERIFSGQLENFARAGDLLVVISASGNSPNVVQVVEFAKSKGLVTIGFLGFDGGIAKSMVDECVWIATEKGDYELVEDCHMVLCHILTRCLAEDSVYSSAHR